MLSKVRGYNDSSGILYNEMNGMRQYASATPMYPVSHNVYPVYKNIENVENIYVYDIEVEDNHNYIVTDKDYCNNYTPNYRICRNTKQICS